jgi:hypothetical protein
MNEAQEQRINAIGIESAETGKDNCVLTIRGLNADQSTYLILILEEYNRSNVLHPEWPECNIKRSAIVCEESGELIREANRIDEGKGSLQNLKTEAIQTAAMAFKMLVKIGGRG